MAVQIAKGLGAHVVAITSAEDKADSVRHLVADHVLPLTVYWRQIDILGSSMGSPSDFADLLAHLEVSDCAPAIDSTYPLLAINDAYARLDHRDRTGQVLLDVTGTGK